MTLVFVPITSPNTLIIPITIYPLSEAKIKSCVCPVWNSETFHIRSATAARGRWLGGI